MYVRLGRAWPVIATVLVALSGASTARAALTTFETGPVRPLAMSPDGTWLFADAPVAEFGHPSATTRVGLCLVGQCHPGRAAAADRNTPELHKASKP